jgi:hypothetical protein
MQHACNVWTEFNMDEEKAKYNNYHIVHPGEEEGRPKYVGCQSFQQYIPPAEREDPDAYFGKRISAQLKNAMDGAPTYIERPVIDAPPITLPLDDPEES